MKFAHKALGETARSKHQKGGNPNDENYTHSNCYFNNCQWV